MKTLLLSAIVLCCCAGSGAAQSRAGTAGASATAIVSVQVVGAGGVAFSREGGASRARGDSRIVVAGGAPELLVEVWRSPRAPGRAERSRELAAEGRVVLQRDSSGCRRGVLGSSLEAALKAAAREPGRYTVAVVY